MTSWTLSVTTRDAASTGFAAPALRAEEGGVAHLTVTRTGVATALLGPAALSISTSGVATPGADFTAPATLRFARGEASKTIDVPIAADAVGEALESFKVTLSAPEDDVRVAGIAAAEVTIGPDNEFSFGKTKLNKKKGTAKLTVNLPGPGQLAVGSKKIKAASGSARVVTKKLKLVLND
jgi:hypothetical protein